MEAIFFIIVSTAIGYIIHKLGRIDFRIKKIEDYILIDNHDKKIDDDRN